VQRQRRWRGKINPRSRRNASTHTYTYTLAHSYTHTHTRTYTHIHTHTHTYVHTHTNTQMHTQTSIRAYTRALLHKDTLIEREQQSAFEEERRCQICCDTDKDTSFACGPSYYLIDSPCVCLTLSCLRHGCGTRHQACTTVPTKLCNCHLCHVPLPYI
jgi:hypothetical protein